MKHTQRRAFTLIELLVVIAIIAILAAILFPLFAQAKLAAKKTQDLSNMKNISMGFMLCTADVDDNAPFNRIVLNGGDWWTARMLNWKDITQPYLKNGNSRPIVGTVYMGASNGGILQSPLSGNPWSNAGVWWGLTGGTGDECTRWPRSYALNGTAGQNELGKNARFWPNVGDGSGPGNMTIFQNPANTIMLATTKVAFPDTWVDMATTFQCTADGTPAGGTGIGCSMTDGGGGANYAFFDGHVKRFKIQATLGSQIWGDELVTTAADLTNRSAAVKVF